MSDWGLGPSADQEGTADSLKTELKSKTDSYMRENEMIKKVRKTVAAIISLT